MRAAVAVQAGGPEVIEVRDVPVPEPGPGQVRVRVAAAGVNFRDTYERSGVYPMPFPHGVGAEGAGTVEALGDGVDPALLGRPVAWCDGRGSYAESVLVDADALLDVPEGLDLPTAAALPIQGMTAHYLLEAARTDEGSTVLLTGAAGGVGLLATQLAVARGATVIGLVGSPAKEDLARAAGCTHVLRYREMADLATELPAAVRALTGGRGVDAVLDGVGRDTFDASLASLRPRGTLVLFGGASGQVPPVDLQRLNAGGSLFVTRPKLGDYVATRDELVSRWEAVALPAARGALTVRIGATVDLGDAAQAHRLIESGTSTGKILVLP